MPLLQVREGRDHRGGQRYRRHLRKACPVTRYDRPLFSSQFKSGGAKVVVVRAADITRALTKRALENKHGE